MFYLQVAQYFQNLNDTGSEKHTILDKIKDCHKKWSQEFNKIRDGQRASSSMEDDDIVRGGITEITQHAIFTAAGYCSTSLNFLKFNSYIMIFITQADENYQHGLEIAERYKRYVNDVNIDGDDMAPDVNPIDYVPAGMLNGMDKFKALELLKNMPTLYKKYCKATKLLQSKRAKKESKLVSDLPKIFYHEMCAGLTVGEAREVYQRLKDVPAKGLPGAVKKEYTLTKNLNSKRKIIATILSAVKVNSMQEVHDKYPNCFTENFLKINLASSIKVMKENVATAVRNADAVQARFDANQNGEEEDENLIMFVNPVTKATSTVRLVCDDARSIGQIIPLVAGADKYAYAGWSGNFGLLKYEGDEEASTPEDHKAILEGLASSVVKTNLNAVIHCNQQQLNAAMIGAQDVTPHQQILVLQSSNSGNPCSNSYTQNVLYSLLCVIPDPDRGIQAGTAYHFAKDDPRNSVSFLYLPCLKCLCIDYCVKIRGMRRCLEKTRPLRSSFFFQKFFFALCL
jgi:hypothetical protein